MLAAFVRNFGGSMSEFCKLLLGKDIYDLDENDLIDFFKNEQEETNTLEFKSGKVDISKLCKEICAFLNTEGGLIIVGAPEETKKTIKKNIYKVCKGELTSSQFNDKDWLYKKIYSRITPVPTKLKIQEINGKVKKYFVIEVNQSYNPPHQLDAEGRYYIRIEREAKPAPHGIIKSLFDKRQKPQPNTIIYIDDINEYKQKIEISILNDSSITAENIMGYITLYGVRNIIVYDSNRLKIIIKKENIYEVRLPKIDYLIKGLSNSNFIEIEHYNKPFLINVLLWCKHSELYEKSILYCPKDKKVIEKYVSGDESRIKFDDLFKKVDKLNNFNFDLEPKQLIQNCNFLEINAKNNVGNLITIENANCNDVQDYSENYFQLTLYDKSGNYNKCFIEKTKIEVPEFSYYCDKTFIGIIKNYPELYSYMVQKIL